MLSVGCTSKYGWRESFECQESKPPRMVIRLPSSDPPSSSTPSSSLPAPSSCQVGYDYSFCIQSLFAPTGRLEGGYWILAYAFFPWCCLCIAKHGLTPHRVAFPGRCCTLKTSIKVLGQARTQHIQVLLLRAQIASLGSRVMRPVATLPGPAP